MRWKFISPDEFPEENSTFFKGIPWLPSKREWWKLHKSWWAVWPWHVFLVHTISIEPYHVLFRSGSHTMRTMWTVKTPYVSVRLGDGAVAFAFTDRYYRPLQSELRTSKSPVKRSEVKKLGGDVTLV